MIPKLSDAEFERLILFVRETFGINLEKKRTLVEARLTFDISQRGFHSFGEYLNVVLNAPEGGECRHMINRLSTNYTFFFREPAALTYVADKLVPELAARGARHMRIWDAACASGEEAYSLAMTLEQTPQVRLGEMSYKILATDINTELLEQARTGRYSVKSLSGIPTEYRRYLAAREPYIQMSDLLMSRIHWQYENLLNSAYQKEWDLIFCRNVMIYFRADTREKLAQKLYDALTPGGRLMIGATENIDLRRRLFSHNQPTIYIKGRTAEGGNV